MIKQEQREKMLLILGNKHIAKIAKYFIENNIVNRDGGFYNTNFISRIFNGDKSNSSNPTVEDGIFKAVEAYKADQIKEQQRIDSMLNNKLEENEK